MKLKNFRTTIEPELKDKCKSRFEKRFEKTDGCWLWLGSKEIHGYGLFSINKRTIIASRASYLIYKGDIEKNKVIMHSCDNPSCVNPSHLSQGSYTDNSQDMKSKGRSLFGERAKSAKLNSEKVIAIRADKRTAQEIAPDYGVSVSTIYVVKSGSRWRHVK